MAEIKNIKCNNTIANTTPGKEINDNCKAIATSETYTTAWTIWIITFIIYSENHVENTFAFPADLLYNKKDVEGSV